MMSGPGIGDASSARSGLREIGYAFSVAVEREAWVSGRSVLVDPTG